MSVADQQLKDAFVSAERGLPGPSEALAETLIQIDAGALRRIHDFLEAAENEPHVSHRLRHLIWVAVDSVVSHLFPGGATTHATMAIKHGATPQQLVEALEIASFASVRGYEIGLDIVLAATRATDDVGVSADRALSEAEAELKRDFTTRMGFWADWMETALALSPEQLRAHLELGYRPLAPGGLTAKDRQLILFACFACPAVSDRGLMRTHATEAVRRGATEAELLQVLRLANCIGLHAIFLGVNTFPELMLDASTRQQ
jgi:alkylhydroperoxidase/carboxymuconolactone decarboxylase family protein YurZ